MNQTITDAQRDVVRYRLLRAHLRRYMRLMQTAELTFKDKRNIRALCMTFGLQVGQLHPDRCEVGKVFVYVITDRGQRVRAFGTALDTAVLHAIDLLTRQDVRLDRRRGRKRWAGVSA